MEYEDDDREDLRYQVELKVNIEGTKFTVNNISSRGLQFVCPEYMIDTIQDTLDKTLFDLDILFPHIDLPCSCQVKVIYTTSNSGSQLVGVSFISMGSEQQEVLNNYLENIITLGDGRY